MLNFSVCLPVRWRGERQMLSERTLKRDLELIKTLIDRLEKTKEADTDYDRIHRAIDILDGARLAIERILKITPSSDSIPYLIMDCIDDYDLKGDEYYDWLNMRCRLGLQDRRKDKNNREIK